MTKESVTLGQAGFRDKRDITYPGSGFPTILSERASFTQAQLEGRKNLNDINDRHVTVDRTKGWRCRVNLSMALRSPAEALERVARGAVSDSAEVRITHGLGLRAAMNASGINSRQY
jgi:hypothetical protein